MLLPLRAALYDHSWYLSLMLLAGTGARRLFGRVRTARGYGAGMHHDYQASHPVAIFRPRMMPSCSANVCDPGQHPSCAKRLLHAYSCWHASAMRTAALFLSRRLMLGRREFGAGGGSPPMHYPRNLPTALSALPALRELELAGVHCLSSAPELELPAAPRPLFANLTSLSVSYEPYETESEPESDSDSAATALYLWLRWALPAAPQLRKLSVSGGGTEGPSCRSSVAA